ncbi:transient receptor potential cation channel subfamily V member 5-like [Dreissena polymorpha]|uniref:transient receptor potential cation channel subfamily V member 5-like n=1 Tax=Dreissena polymorpha TaxID=45954 RepID=UPI0022654B48|nr:transient receptor potential cation channel subfamily V member 5-like [Dreissena polymorpha]XP_052222254.1 transient receptor potential cation channel subfamily V member 5-like [Dreissena polymorpha]
MVFNKKKAYQEHYQRLVLNENDISLYFEELKNVVSCGEFEKVKILLDVLKRAGKTRTLASYRAHEGESMLHIAAKFNQSSEITECLVKLCPELMTTARKESQNYFGQTALHVAIAKGNIEIVEVLLSQVYSQSQSVRAALLQQCASGDMFANTVMMGELPLSVAALTFNEQMIDLLLRNGAELERQNTKGETVLHSLIRYAAIYPEHAPEVHLTMEYLHEKIISMSDSSIKSASMDHDQNSKYFVWFIPNHQNQNPLQLSASLSQPDIFEFILRLRNVYCFLNNHDGLFDEKSYDITDIDTIATEKWAMEQTQKHERLKRYVAPTNAEGVSREKFSPQTTISCDPFALFRRQKRKSVLETMFDIKSSSAFEFIQQDIVHHVIKTKWLTYRYFYYAWGLFHLLFMVALTIYGVYRAETYEDILPQDGNISTTTSVSMTTKSNPTLEQQGFLNVFMWIYLVVGILYFLQELFHLFFRVKSYELVQLVNILHNGIYRIILTMFSVCLVLDVIVTRSITNYENHTLMIALITGWWFTMFFTRAYKKFSFFTVMIQKIIFGDMIRFSLLILVMLIAFTTALHMTFKGSTTSNTNLVSFQHTMLLMFKLMLGLGEIEELYEARRPWIAVTLFVIFVILTYVLMLNALVAMMSQTCTLVSENRHVQWRVQQLSIIMFFEGILPPFMKKQVGKNVEVDRYDQNTRTIDKQNRFFLDMSAVRTEYASPEDIIRKKKSLPFPGYSSPNFTMTTWRDSVYNSRHSVRAPRLSTVMEESSPTIPPKMKQEQFQSPNRRADYDYDSSPNLQRGRSSRREKNPVNPQEQGKTNQDDGSGMIQNRETQPSKRKSNKKRIEPEGDTNSYDEQNSFFLNDKHMQLPRPSTMPDSQYKQLQGILHAERERRRYHSESQLMDTYVGNPQQREISQEMGSPQNPRYPIWRVQPQDGPTNQNAPSGSLDINIISDSHM